jgi:hypothetical protein
MSKIKIEIKTDSDAFKDDPNLELAAILREFADDLERGKTPSFLMDSNGNTVGAVRRE